MLEGVFDLEKSRPLMCSTRISGGSTFLFESLGKYYIYDELHHVVLRITEPTTLTEIVDAIRDHGLQDLSTQVVEPVRNRGNGDAPCQIMR